MWTCGGMWTRARHHTWSAAHGVRVAQSVDTCTAGATPQESPHTRRLPCCPSYTYLQWNWGYGQPNGLSDGTTLLPHEVGKAVVPSMAVSRQALRARLRKPARPPACTTTLRGQSSPERGHGALRVPRHKGTSPRALRLPCLPTCLHRNWRHGQPNGLSDGTTLLPSQRR